MKVLFEHEIDDTDLDAMKLLFGLDTREAAFAKYIERLESEARAFTTGCRSHKTQWDGIERRRSA